MISDKQKKILAFPYSRYDAIICDGAVRSGKTSIMMWAFVRWATEPDVGRTSDGLSAWLDRIGGLIDDAAKERAGEILRDVRETFNEETIQRYTGRFQDVLPEEILLAFLCEYSEGADRGGTTMESRTVAETVLRDLWRTIEAARASHQREYRGEYDRKYSDALLRLSHGAPSMVPQAWENGSWEDGIERTCRGTPNRVDRLKCLGNAVVPQQAYGRVLSRKMLHLLESLRAREVARKYRERRRSLNEIR